MLALAMSKVLENMEIGHNVLHGQYDFMRDPRLSSATYEWGMVGTAKSWKRAHNATHHVFTNVIGRDGHFGYKLFRFSEDVPWKLIHLAQPLLSPLSGLFFQYSIGAYDLEFLDRVLPGRASPRAAKPRPMTDLTRELWAFLKKAARKSFVEYAFYPALAGPFALKVLAGNALADAMRNGWAYVVIYCGHLTEGAATFREEDLVNEDRAQWYVRQVMGSGNFEIGRLGHLLGGHLGFQIEHHLFPRIPAWRYPDMAPRVRGICERHGIAYHSGPLFGAVRERNAPARPVHSSRKACEALSSAGARLPRRVHGLACARNRPRCAVPDHVRQPCVNARAGSLTFANVRVRRDRPSAARNRPSCRGADSGTSLASRPSGPRRGGRGAPPPRASPDETWTAPVPRRRCSGRAAHAAVTTSGGGR